MTTPTDLTAAELSFILRCQDRYEEKTGQKFNTKNYDKDIAVEVVGEIKAEMFIEKINEYKSKSGV